MSRGWTSEVVALTISGSLDSDRLISPISCLVQTCNRPTPSLRAVRTPSTRYTTTLLGAATLCITSTIKRGRMGGEPGSQAALPSTARKETAWKRCVTSPRAPYTTRRREKIRLQSGFRLCCGSVVHRLDSQLTHVTLRPGSFYGVSHFPCCITNFPQGWPKFAQHVYLVANSTKQTELLVASLVPSNASFVAGNGAPVKIRTESEFPFGDVAKITVEVGRGWGETSGGQLLLKLRVPGYANATIDGKSVVAGTTWEQALQLGTTKTWSVILDPELTPEFGWGRGVAQGADPATNAVAITRGPLVFAYRPREERSKLVAGEETHTKCYVERASERSLSLSLSLSPSLSLSLSLSLVRAAAAFTHLLIPSFPSHTARTRRNVHHTACSRVSALLYARARSQGQALIALSLPWCSGVQSGSEENAGGGGRKRFEAE